MPLVVRKFTAQVVEGLRLLGKEVEGATSSWAIGTIARRHFASKIENGIEEAKTLNSQLIADLARHHKEAIRRLESALTENLRAVYRDCTEQRGQY